MYGDVKWIEVYAAGADLGFYLLTLRALKAGTFELLDPQRGGEVIEKFSSYDDATHWLTEDEYQLVGRLQDGSEEDAAATPPDPDPRAPNIER